MRKQITCKCGHTVFDVGEAHPIKYQLFSESDQMEERVVAVEVDPPAFPDQTNVYITCERCGEVQDIIPDDYEL